MLSISSMSVGHASYYMKFARGSYYAKDASGDGKWLGTGAAALGLAGSVDAGDLKRLFEGFHPNGKELVQNAGTPDRQAGLDLTFSAEKTVSILSEMTAQVDRAEIEQAHHAAVETALEYLQDTSIWTRRGKGGVKLEPTSLVAAAFTHHTSRNLDPNLHTHVLLLNIGVRADGTTGTIRTSDLFHHKMVAGAIYRAQLAYELTHRLGFEIETGERGLFRILGVPDEVRDAFSSRRKELEQAVDPAFHADAKTMARATLATRPAKKHEDLDTLRNNWRAVLDELGWSLDNVPRRARRLESTQERQKHLEQLIATGLTETPSLAFEQDQHSLVDQKPAFAERDLVRYLAEHATDGAFTAHDVIGAVRNELALQSGPVRLGQDNPYDIWATHPTLSNERAVIDDVAALSRTRWGGIGLRQQKRMLRGAHAKGITDDAMAAMAALTSPGASISILQGRAGTGKTTLLDHVNRALIASGYTVIGAAPSARAAQELERGAGIQAKTVASRLLQLQRSRSKLPLGKGQRDLLASSGKKTPASHSFEFDSKTVLVLDESSMVSTQDLMSLIRHSKERNAKVILTGDVRQLPAVRGASPFARLIQMLGAAELTQNHRQKPMWLRHAAFQIAEGRPAKALSLLAREGRLRFSSTQSDAVRQLVDAWGDASETGLKDKLLLAGTRAEVAALNTEAQLARQARGKLSDTSVAHGVQRIHVGDRIAFRRNDRKLDLRNGDFGTVTRLRQGGVGRSPKLVVTHDDGRRIDVDLRKYTDIELGYAVTAHRAQGATVSKAFALLNSTATSAEMAYVQLTRARHDTHAIVLDADDAEHSKTHTKPNDALLQLSRAMQRKSRTPLAHEVQRTLTNPDEELER